MFFCGLLSIHKVWGQGTLRGSISSKGEPVEFASILIKGQSEGTMSDSLGQFSLKIKDTSILTLQVSRLGFKTLQRQVDPSSDSELLNLELEELDASLDEVVVSGTLEQVSRSNSPVPVEVYKDGFFKANPTPSIFESLQTINGVRPQINCNICNTGDIHINGLEGPYTMILIDGMPIVSGLATVYGLSGIPQSLVDRIEIVKGPASTLYGSEAVGGLINVITKNSAKAPVLSVDYFGTTWSEHNLDLGLKTVWGRRVQSLTGLNMFTYDRPVDNNGDGMTDLTLAKRFSIFQKLSWDRKSKKEMNIAGRFVYEDRWGGQMDWTPEARGGDKIYGESIFTQRWELFGNYELPVAQKINFQFSANGHDQNSAYGDMLYLANQTIAFGQLTWNQSFSNHQLLSGVAYRYTYYDDNTPATRQFESDENAPSIIHLPGVFIQDEIHISDQSKLLLGVRSDFNSRHGMIFSPRLNYKLQSEDQSTVFRFSLGNGFRVANVFTEDHAALTGAREVVFAEELNPEQSWNTNVNLVKKIYTDEGDFISFDASAFYTHFSNRIVPDYESNPNQIIYANLDGEATSAGFSLNSTLALRNGFEGNLGFTLMDVSLDQNGQRIRQLLTERFSAVWNLGYTFPLLGLQLNYTGNLYSPMRLPLLGELDQRSSESPWWSIQNIQLTKKINDRWELYGGVKNLLNFTPPANSIVRAFDPFDRGVEFGADGSVLPTPSNPQALTFDPTYMFAPNQGIRGFFGVRYTVF
ncbi:outer membrane receptor for ferrienterochelin and colicins [Algoriphagus faecimaris]|uniref:Outer membrane receptor for ferrienterochelin and colicins n=2 Tax=Algoriphagus faecimaris TaxID=686796 RepID=A0A1G6Y436_9BACT|nr:TonB-dependent receptor [Algoriphagus faecimaris]SDD84477.1 outer membrane receptor for ferrienterochelin and colicins [Algoriphagus faecimaris]